MNQTAGNSMAGSGDARRNPGAAAPPDPSQDGAAAELEARIAELEARIAEQETRIAELKDGRLRALADLDNVRKRCTAQVSRAEAETRAAVAREWLPVVDNLDRALAHSTADPASIIDGIRVVRAQALEALARLGFPRRDDRGAKFDPARHEAIASRPDPGAEDGSVVEVVRPAYGEGDHQLRPAQVVVARAG
jgi:molecular chaperone GrpE